MQESWVTTSTFLTVSQRYWRDWADPEELARFLLCDERWLVAGESCGDLTATRKNSAAKKKVVAELFITVMDSRVPRMESPATSAATRAYSEAVVSR